MYIDVYFAVNLVVDRCALECAMGRIGISKWRLWLGAFAGAAGACVWKIWVNIAMLQPIGALGLSMLMVYVCIGKREWRQWCSLLLQLYGYGFLFAGVIPYVSRYVPLWIVSVLISFGGIKLWLYRQTKKRQQQCRLIIEAENKRWEAWAMIDTGHLLKEAVTGKAVIIVKGEALPNDWIRNYPILYQSVQGQGLMYGFWPQKLWIEERLFKEKEVLVAAAEEWKEDNFSAIIPGYLME